MQYHHSLANHIGLTLICFFAYAIMSGLLSQIGVLSEPMAAAYGQSVVDSATRFSYLGSGILIGSVSSLLIYERLTLKQGLIGCHLLVAIALTTIFFTENWDWLPLPMFVAGAAASLGVNTAAIVLALIYSPARRPQALLTTDITFAVAGIVATPAAVMLIAANAPWSSSYLIIGLIAGALIPVILMLRFPQTLKEATSGDDAGWRWPMAAYLCGLVLFFYLLGQMSMSVWLPNYIQHNLGGTLVDGGSAISRFWTGMALGQLVLVLALARIPDKPLLIGCAVMTAVLSSLIWLGTSVDSVVNLSLVLGLCASGVLKLTLSFASTLVEHPQRLVASMLVCASAGSASAPWVSSQIVAVTNTHSALIFMTICFTLTALLVIASISLNQRAKHAASSLQQETR